MLHLTFIFLFILIISIIIYAGENNKYIEKIAQFLER